MGKKEGEERGQHVLQSDTANEQVVLSAALVDEEVRRFLVKKLRGDHFFLPEHAAAWEAMRELDRRKLAFDLATVQRLAGDRVDVDYLVKLIEVRGDAAPDNLNWHVDALHWDHTRLTAAKGPVASLLDALRDPKQEPERVRAIARQVAQAFDGHGGNALHDNRQLIAEQISEIKKRAEGKAVWPFGVEGLDLYEEGGRRRLVPGAAPGQVTVVTGTSGSGKSTFSANLTLGIARSKRRVCYAAWEPTGGMTIELLACISLGWSRSELLEGVNMTHDRVVELEERMHAIGKYVRFMRNPFRSTKKKSSNALNLDVVQDNIADSGAEVFVADLWERCLHDTDPNEEKEALFRQQAMAEEMRVHCILLAQQRHKDVEMRPDKRPTREGIKGSGAWVEVADTILGVHRPALWKDVADDKLEVLVLKQRWGKWPLAVGFAWDAVSGRVWDGHDIPYEHPGEMSESNPVENFVKNMQKGKGRR